MKFYPIHMHLHASHEETSSIGAHMFNAKKIGINHLWITEHDVRMGEKKISLPEFEYTQKELSYRLPSGIKAGFEEEEKNSGKWEFVDTDRGISLSVEAKRGEYEGLWFKSGKSHSDPLFSYPTLAMNAEIELYDENSSVIFEFVLSAQPPSCEQARLRYFLGKRPEYCDETMPVQYVPFPERSADGYYYFRPAYDVGEEVGGLDNAMCYNRLVIDALDGEGARVVFNRFAFSRELEFEAVRQVQIKEAKRLSLKWGVTAFVGYEVTGRQDHNNCYGTSVPVIDRKSRGFKVSQGDALRHIREHGGIYSYNHPFFPWRKLGLTEEQKWEVVDKRAKNFIETNVKGATLMEVAFPYVKNDFYDRHHLGLWDRLSSAGVFVTGDGDSDNHHAGDNGWIYGNNFCTWAGMTEDEEPNESGFISAFKRGSVFASNPVLVRDIDFTASGKPQGSVTVGNSVRVDFKANDIKCDGYALRIVNGKTEQRVEIKDGAVEDSFTLECSERYNFARMEIRDTNDILVALTNPVYLVGAEEDVPELAIKNGRYVK